MSKLIDDLKVKIIDILNLQDVAPENFDEDAQLVGVKKAEFFIDSLPFGGLITGRAENTQSFENLREVFCQLQLNERLIGKATLQLFQVNH